MPDGSEGAARHAPATTRNRDPIAALLAETLPAAGLVLEVASGTGEHAVHFARRLPGLTFQPSDPDPAARASIAAHRAGADLPNLREPLDLDALSPAWPLDAAAAVVAINMVHISPWAATLGLLDGAARLLRPGGPLVFYGPFLEAGREPAPSNLAFDADLRARDPAWGLRRLDAVREAAAERRLGFSARHAMPANNLLLVFRRL